MSAEINAEAVAKAAAEITKTLYADKIESVYLYGSYARGDYDEESDIDIFVILNCSEDELPGYRSVFSHISSELSLKNDITVSISIAGSADFSKYKNHLPYYINIVKEGLKIA